VLINPVFSHSPNVVAEWLTILILILQALISNLGLETGYPD
jgi:hypothetical protein